jgi:signal transduction histidine kinase
VRSTRPKPSLTLALVAALVALLPLLAFLQFRWVGEVSRAERDRMRASLKTAVANFSRDFDEELTRAYLALQMDGKTLRDRAWRDYAKRFDQWLRAAPHPQLVASVFLIEPDANLKPRLSQFNYAASAFEPAVWPARLEPLRERFESEFKAGRDEMKAFPKPAMETLIEDGPALAAPVADAGLLDKPEIPDPAAFSGYTLVALDLDFIKQSFIPELAARYFANGEGLDYSLAIASRRDPEKIIYQSDQNIADKAPTGDATAPLFDLRIDMPLLSEASAREVETTDDRVAQKGNLQKENLQNESLEKENLQKENLTVRVFNTVVKKGAARDLGTSRLALINGEGGLWQAILRHRAGSLDLAVAAVRRRNLVISFIILLFLSASITMIIISSRRAAKLAAQQMEFVAGVSHEMRTPLAVICSAGENLADGVIDDRRQVRRYGALIESEGRRLSDMIEQALEFAGIQSGRKTYALRPVDLRCAIESALEASEPLMREGGFRIEKEIAADLPLVQADAAALSRSIQNLLSNAMKYSGESLWIRIKAETVATERGLEAQVTVEDRGLGVEPSELKRIFEPFYRGREATEAQIHGSGLGLSLVKRIIEAHGGRVSVKSADGRGSAFTLHLPAAVQAEQGAIT